MGGTTEIFGYRISKEKIKSIADFLYLTVFALLLGYYFLVTTTFPIEWRENFPAYLRVLLIVVILIKLTYVEIYDLKEVLFAALISLCFLAVWIRTSDPLVLNTLLLILGSKGTSFEKILKVYVAVTAGLLAITMAAALLGFTENLVYIQEGRSPRIAFGICYPTDFSAHVLYSLLAYGYLRRERIHYVELALMAGAGVFVYVFCDARVNTVCILVATGAFLYNKIRHKRAEKQGKIYVMNRIWSWLLAMSTVICALFMTLMTVFYSSENPLTAFLNRLINFRLSYGKKGVDLFGFSLLGSVYPDDRKRGIRKRIGNVFLSGLFLYESGAAVWNCPAWHYFDHLQCDRFFRDPKEKLGTALDPCGCGGAVYDRASYDGYFL